MRHKLCCLARSLVGQHPSGRDAAMHFQGQDALGQRLGTPQQVKRGSHYGAGRACQAVGVACGRACSSHVHGQVEDMGKYNAAG